MKSYNIAALLTCHNRKENTKACLKSLFSSLDYYNDNHDIKITLKVFLVDDGCTDGTPDEIKNTFVDMNVISIIKGDGNLFWARGMALAWKSALEVGNVWDFFLLVNDDTIVYNDCFRILIETNCYSLDTYHRPGLYSGITCKIGDPERITYGGAVWTNRFLVKYRQLTPTGYPQMCEIANANILLVPVEVMNEIGILNDYYQHGFADFEYSIKARKRGIPVLVTSEICGECDNDHIKNIDSLGTVSKLDLRERREFYKSPLHPNRDYLYYIRHNFPERYPFVVIGRFLSLYFPQVYCLLRKLRGS